VIRDAQAAGLSIADITVFVGQYMAQDDTSGDGQTFLDAKITEVSGRLQAAQRFLEMLEQTKAALERAPRDGLAGV
jgi:DNA-binding transcriptional MerR regulator